MHPASPLDPSYLASPAGLLHSASPTDQSYLASPAGLLHPASPLDQSYLASPAGLLHSASPLDQIRRNTFSQKHLPHGFEELLEHVKYSGERRRTHHDLTVFIACRCGVEVEMARRRFRLHVDFQRGRQLPAQR